MTSSRSGSILEIHNLSFMYGGHLNTNSQGKSGSRAALRNVSFTVNKGEIFALLGPNGGGKTTLFKILSTTLVPSSGSVTLLEWDVEREASKVRSSIGVVFQSPSLDKKLTVSENLIHQGHLYGIFGKPLRDRISYLLDRVRLQNRSSDLVETLSGGLQRRIEIAKGLIHSPLLMLMDEPSTGLDPGARLDLWDYLQELTEQGMTILLTTHLMEEAEKCDRLAILNEGELVAIGTPAALKEEIGGDVITVETKDPKALSEQIQKKFGLGSVVIGNAIRIEKERGHEFVPQIVQSTSGEILSITVGKPTLEDVFIHRTGHRFFTSHLS